MFDFQELFQWDRFNGPDSTEQSERPDFLGPLEGRSSLTGVR
jgi:hypothetical protein